MIIQDFALEVWVCCIHCNTYLYRNNGLKEVGQLYLLKNDISIDYITLLVIFRMKYLYFLSAQST